MTAVIDRENKALSVTAVFLCGTTPMRCRRLAIREYEPAAGDRCVLWEHRNPESDHIENKREGG
jgi:hypothetical protein